MDTTPLRRIPFAILLVLAACGGGGAAGVPGDPLPPLPPTLVEVLRTRALGLEQQVQAFSADTPCDSDAECRVAALDPQTGCSAPRALAYSVKSTAAASAASAAADLVEIRRQLWWQEHPDTVCPAVIYPLPRAVCSVTERRCVTQAL